MLRTYYAIVAVCAGDSVLAFVLWLVARYTNNFGGFVPRITGISVNAENALKWIGILTGIVAIAGWLWGKYLEQDLKPKSKN